MPSDTMRRFDHKGTVFISPLSDTEVISGLKIYYPHSSFAKDMIESYGLSGRLTRNQWAASHKMVLEKQGTLAKWEAAAREPIEPAASEKLFYCSHYSVEPADYAAVLRECFPVTRQFKIPGGPGAALYSFAYGGDFTSVKLMMNGAHCLVEFKLVSGVVTVVKGTVLALTNETQRFIDAFLSDPLGFGYSYSS